MHGFRLTQEAKDEGFSGGTINCNPLGHAFDVGEAISQGDGAFYTDNAGLAEILRSYPALESIPDDELPSDPTLVEVPGLDVLVAPNVGPWQPQTPQRIPEEGGLSEVSAEHADEPASVAEAVTQGEQVSGLGASGVSRFGTSSSSDETDEHDEED